MNPKTDFTIYLVISLGYKRPPECCANAVEGMSQCRGSYTHRRIGMDMIFLSHDQEPGLKLAMPVKIESNPRRVRKAGAM